MFSLIETMRLDNGEVKRLSYHKKRIEGAIHHFKLNVFDFEGALHSYIEKNNLYIGIYRLRVEYNNDLKITHDLLEDKEEIDANLLKMESTDSDYLEYKTTVRSQYVTTTYPFALYYDSKNRLTEFNIGNVVVKEADGYYTPRENGLLNGVMRQFLIDSGKIKIRDYTLDEFIEIYHEKKIEIYLINSLREWVKVNLHV